MSTSNATAHKTIRLALLLAVLCAACSGPAAPTATATVEPTSVPPTAVPTATLPPAATATALPPTTTPAPTLTATPTRDVVAEMDAFLTGQAGLGFMSGAVLVGHNGEVVFEKGYGLADREQQIAITPQTKFHLGGFTQQFTAMAILILADRGQVDLQASVCTYVPDCPDAWQPVTLHHLLTHTSGLPERLDETQPLEPGSPPVEQAVARFRDVPLAFAPGTGALGSNPGFVLLAYVIEQVSGQSYEAFLHANIFEPLGMTHTGQLEGADDLAQRYANGFATTPIVNPFDVSLWSGAGGLYSTVEDLWLWDQALYTEDLVSQAMLDRMFTVWVPKAAQGYGFTISAFEGKRLYTHLSWMPGMNSHIDRYVDDHLVVIMLANQSDVDTHFFNGLLALKVLKP